MSLASRDELLASAELRVQGLGFVASREQKAVSGRRGAGPLRKLQVLVPEDGFVRRKIERAAQLTARLGSRFERVGAL